MEIPKIDMNTMTKKVLTIAALTLFLMIPLCQVERQVHERRSYESVAQEQVAKGWGTDITFFAPTVYWMNKSYSSTTSETTLNIVTQEKKRGVFLVPAYVATFKSKVTFPQYEKPAAKKDEKLVDCLFMALSSSEYIQSYRIKDVKSGKELKAIIVKEGIRLNGEDLPEKDFRGKTFEVEVSVRGTGKILYKTSADQDKVKFVGNWLKPKFIDEVLPEQTQLSGKGFEASWVLNALDKSIDAARTVKTIGMENLWIGTDYSRVEKAVKYGSLFIALTFMLILLVESLNRIKIHPFQYILIGVSITIFYLLLLAISEVMSFDMAYLISALAVSALIGVYIQGFIKERRFVKMIMAEQLSLNTFFYVLLCLEERAFLVGTLGLFLVLAVFMIVTRKFDWYAGLPKNAKGSS